MPEDQDSVLAGRFELLDQLGHGAMGVVWRARDRQTGQLVAIKVLQTAAIDDPELRKRFEREADLAAKIESKRVVRVLGHGMATGNRPFIVMELVEGHSLRDVMAAHGPYRWDEIRPFLLTIARALADAHAEGVIHRDVKPSNVMVTADGSIKLADFGIARDLDQTRLTRTAATIGTPAYLAPEGSVDQRSDLYAIGIIAYEMLAGRPPFMGDTPQEVLLSHLRSEPDLSKIPTESRRVVGWLLAKDPARRPQSAEALVAALQAGVTATIVMPNASSGAGSPRARTLAILGGLALVVIVVAVAVVGSGALAASRPSPDRSGMASLSTASPELSNGLETGGSTLSGVPSNSPTATPVLTTATPEISPSPSLPSSGVAYAADWSGGLNGSGWTGTADWSVQNGQLVSDGTGDTKFPSANAPVSPTWRDYSAEADIHVVGGCGSFGIAIRWDGSRGGFGAGYRCADHALQLRTIGDWPNASQWDGPLAHKSFTPNDWFRLRIEAQGKEVRVYVDGLVQIDYKYDDNSNLDAGTIGLWADKTQLAVRSFVVMQGAPIAVDAPTAPPTSYSADWSAGLNSSGWTGTADWQIQTGNLVSDGTGGSIFPSSNAPVVPTGRNYAVEADIHVIGGCGSFGIAVRWDGGGGGFGAGYRCADQQLQLRTIGDWPNASQWDGPLDKKTFSPSGWFKLRIEVQDKEVRVFVNGLQQINYKYDANNNLSPGYIGLWSDKTQIEVRSFSVSAL
jgi:serine/threonine protein kinase